MATFQTLFLADRDYVRGCSLFSIFEMSGLSPTNFDRLDFSVNGFVKTNAVDILSLADFEANHSTNEIKAKYVANLGKSVETLVAISNSQSDFEEHRLNYDEESLLEKSNIDDSSQTIKNTFFSDTPTLQQAVSLNKRLMEVLFPEEDGKWVFCRLQLKQNLPKNGSELMLKFVRNMKQTYVSEITIDGVVFGNITFWMMK